MTLSDLIAETLVSLKPLVVHIIVVMSITFISLIYILINGKKLNMSRKTFGWYSVLYSIDEIECVRLSGAWIRTILILSYLISCQRMNILHYIFLIIAGMLSIVSAKEPIRIPARFLWFILELAGLFACNLIITYTKDMRAGVIFMVIYVLMSIFEGLFAIYLFVTELSDISSARSNNLEEIK